MILRKKVVKCVLGAGLLAAVFQPLSCSVSPELVDALTGLVQNVVQSRFDNFTPGGPFWHHGHFPGDDGQEDQSDDGGDEPVTLE